MFYLFFYKVNLQTFESDDLQENQHPPGLRTLFFTEMWERMSFYGMRGILVLFMTATISEGGLNFNNISASAIYGIYAASVYLVTLPGGWIGDRLIGQQKAVLYGGFIIMFGHFSLALPNINAFYLGLLFVVLGTGLLKPNISAIVGTLYERNESNRQSGFTIFYMAINIGSILGFFICGFLGEQIGWHYGFGAAGIGMALGLIQYIYSRSLLGEAGLHPSKKLSEKARKRNAKNFICLPSHNNNVYCFSVSWPYNIRPFTNSQCTNRVYSFGGNIILYIYIFLWGFKSGRKKENCNDFYFISWRSFFSGLDLIKAEAHSISLLRNIQIEYF